jgi:HEAT repeat protein
VLFTHASKDVSFLVRAEAAAALGRSQDARVVDLLGELLEDPEESVQQQAALALAEIKNDKAKAYLTLQYARGGRSTRLAIIEGLRSASVQSPMSLVVSAEAKAIWERNLQALGTGSLAEKVGAAEDLGKSGRPDAVERLGALTQDGQVKLVAAAVRGLGNTGDDKLAPKLTGFLRETSPELREAAIQALGRLGDPQALDALAERAEDVGPDNALALDALASMPPSPKHDAVLCAVAFKAPEPVAVEAALQMRQRGGCPLDALEKKRGEKLSPESVSAGLVAVRGLGPTAKAALSWVLPLASDKDARVRGLALQALGELGDPSAVPVVEKAFLQEQESLRPLRAKWVNVALPEQYASDQPDSKAARQQALFQKVEEVRMEKVREAGKLPLVSRPPSELVDDVPEEALRGLASAALALGQLRSKLALEKLKPLSGEDSPLLRGAAYSGLAYLGPAGLALARNGLADPDRDVQAMTAKALVEQGDSGMSVLLEVLPKLTGDRIKLLEALWGKTLPPSALAPLSEVLRQGGGEVGEAAALLGTLKQPAAATALLKALDEPGAPGRPAILVALGQSGDPKARDVISRDLASDTPEVRAAAAQALGQLGATGQTDALKALTQDYYLTVRASAQHALQAAVPAKAEGNK